MADSSTPGGNGSPGKQPTEQQELATLIGQLVTGKIDKSQMRRLVWLLKDYVKIGRKGIGVNGKGLVDLLLFVAPRLPVRTSEQLQDAYGVSGGSLAAKVIKSAGRTSAGVGGVTGALATAGELAPPLWLTLPVEILAETLLVTAVEMRMIAELHEVFDLPLAGSTEERGLAIVEAWSTRRGVDMKRLRKDGRTALERDHGVAHQITRMVKRKLVARAARNLGTLAPMFIGAAIGAETNRRSTRDVGNAIVKDLKNRVTNSKYFA